MSRSYTSKQPAIEPALQSRLVAKFGTKILKEGFTAVPVAVQRYYRLVPGEPVYSDDGKLLHGKIIYNEQGEEVDVVSYMTPTEYSIMVDIWSWWWSADVKPWPSVAQIAAHLQKSERTIQRYLDRLENKGFMIALYQYSSTGKQLSNRYDFTPFLTRLIEYLDSTEPPTKKSGIPDKGDKNAIEGVTEVAGTGMTEKPPKANELADTVEIENNPNGVAISTRSEGGAVAVEAIRNLEVLVPEKEGTVSTTQNSNGTQQSENRKEEKEKPADLQNEQYEIGQYKTPHHAIESLIKEFVPILNDQQAMESASLMQSDIKRATNLFDKYGVFTQENVQTIMHQARIIALAVEEEEITSLNPDGSKNRMRLFYYWLRNRIEKFLAPDADPPRRRTNRKTRRPAANGKPSATPKTTATPQSATMSSQDAETIAQDAEALGLEVAVLDEDTGSTVMLTWHNKPVPIRNLTHWQTLRPTFARHSTQ